mgnify:CR=1 FL=1
MNEELIKAITNLTIVANQQADAAEAMKFAQAVLNLSQALIGLTINKL